MITGAVVAAVLWIIYMILLVVTLKPWERIHPSAALLVLVFLEVAGVTGGYIISGVWSYFNG